MDLETARVLQHQAMGESYRVLTFAAPVIAPQVRPGQFVHLRVPNLEGAVLRRPFSVYQTRGPRLSILYKCVGRGTCMMTQLARGDEVSLLGPLGNGFPADLGPGFPVLVAGGYGIAPLLMLARSLSKPGIVFEGATSADGILCRREFRAIGWPIRIATEDGTLGQKGLVTDALDKWLARDAKDRPLVFCACGPMGMLRAVGERAIRAGWPAWLSLDRHMGCGVGACLTCVQKIRKAAPKSRRAATEATWARVCREGPVFECREIMWEAGKDVTPGNAGHGKCLSAISVGAVRAAGADRRPRSRNGLPDMSVRIGRIRMRNPVMVASGTFGYGPEYADVVDLRRLGAIVVKGISLEPWQGNATPRTVEVPGGLVNAIGLQNPGFEGFVARHMPFLRKSGIPVIVNIWGRTVDEYAELAARFSGVRGVSGLEINISCPNIKEGGIAFGVRSKMAAKVVAAARRKTRLCLIPKLPPNVPNIADFARAVEAEGADAISLINSVPAMVIDVETRKPLLANVTGGLTGPAVHPIAVKLVYEAARAVKIPVIGMGGITGPEEALEFLIAGASAVAVGTANFTDPRTPLLVADGIERYLKNHGIRRVSDLVGTLQA